MGEMVDINTFRATGKKTEKSLAELEEEKLKKDEEERIREFHEKKHPGLINKVNKAIEEITEEIEGGERDKS